MNTWDEGFHENKIVQKIAARGIYGAIQCKNCYKTKITNTTLQWNYECLFITFTEVPSNTICP